MKKIAGILLFVFSGMLVSAFPALGETLFGPHQYIRATEGTTVFTDPFTTLAGNARLYIENGEYDGDHRVDNQISSARVFINDTQIYGPSDFNQNVYILETLVNLAENNSIKVELNGSPDSFLTIRATRPSVTITADPEIILLGDSSTLSWESSDAETCTIEPGIGTIAINGSTVVSPSETTVYTFTVTDPVGITATASREIRVNRMPVADPQSIATDEDLTVAITLSGTDVDGDVLAYQISSGPLHGTLSGESPNLIYSPNPNFNGSDTFSFVVNDGMVDSIPAVIDIAIAPVNDPPVADTLSIITDEDTPVAVSLTGTDAENDPLTFQVITNPVNGALSGSAPDLTYTPNPDYHGPDAFTITANDGALASEQAAVTININSINDAPVADAGVDQSVFRGDTVNLNGSGSSDVDGDTLSYQWTIVTLPAESTAALSDPASSSPTFVADVTGTYEVQLSVNDGMIDSALTQVTITTNPRLVAVPDVVGLPQSDAENAIATAGLAIGALSSAHHDTVPAGSVISQNPPSEEVVEEFSQVDLVLSLGPLSSGPPEVNLTATPETIQIGDSFTLTWSATNAQNAYIDNGIGAIPTNGSAILSPEHTTTYTFTATGPEGSASAKVMVTVMGNPASQPEGSFGEQYNDLVPPDATVESYDVKRFSLITGLVQDLDNLPISDVFITIHQHPEYGTVATDAEGRFTIPVEGGGILTLIYQKDGLIQSQRQVYVPWNDIAIAETTQMIAEDPVATTLTFDGDPDTVVTHVSTEVSDDFGSRSATMIFTGDNMAYLMNEEGNDVQQLSTITTRATEFTTPESMPAVLPPNSAYTYCVELAVDGAQRVRFAKPVTTWIDNFLGFDVGEIVPVGYYDRDRGVWVPSDNGVVVRLLDTSGDGIVDALDADGDDQPDDLDSNGSLSNEVLGLDDPVRYAPDETFWRVAITHFTPWDTNWPYGPPLDATPPNPQGPPSVDQQDDGTAPDDIQCSNSYINKRSRVYHEDIPIPGTDMTLHYASNRVEGYKTVISVPASGDTIPQDLNKIIVKVDVAGRTFEQVFDPLPNQKAEFIWDGLDHLGTQLSRSVKANVSVGFGYEIVYYLAASGFGQAFAQAGSEVTGVRGRQDIVLWKRFSITVSETENIEKDPIAEGWSLSKHHFSKTGVVLEKGDGEKITSHQRLNLITNLAGTTHGFSGDGGPATAAQLYGPIGITVDKAGNIYVADSVNDNIRKVNVNGVINTVAGNGTYGFSGDGGPATNAWMRSPNDLAIDSVGNLYISDQLNNRIRKVDVNGVINTVVGNGIKGTNGDGGPAIEAELNNPRSLTFDVSGNLYIASSNVIRKVDVNGIITTVAGGNGSGFSGDGGPATEAKFNNIYDIALDSAGNLYVADVFNRRVRKVDTSGIVSTVAGNGLNGYSGDGGAATGAALFPYGVAIDNTGNLYIADPSSYRIRVVNTSGVIDTVAGNGTFALSGFDGPATEAGIGQPTSIYVDSNSNLYFTATSHILGMTPLYSFLSAIDNILFYEKNGKGHVLTGSGLHLATIDLDSEVVLSQFGYDQGNNLVSITDQFGNQTTIGRDINGVPVTITSPDGLTTALTIDVDNHLTRITYPDGTYYSFEYTPGGLMTAETEPAGNRFDHQFNLHGRLMDAYDEEGGHWNYTRSALDTGDILVQLQTAEGNITSYLDYTYSTGAYESTVTDADGAQTLFNRSADGLTVDKSLPCGMDISYKYGLDPEYKYEFVKEFSELAPSGLERIVLKDKTYQDTDADEVPDLITETVSVNGKATILSNNVLQSQKTVTSPENRTVTINYDPATLVTNSVVTSGLFDTTYGYDTRGRLTSTATNTRVTSYGYNTQGFLDHVTDPENHTTSYSHDAVGRVTSINRPDGTSLGFTHDLNGNMTILTNPILVNHGFGYNKVNLQSSYQTPFSGTYSYVYDMDRRLTRTNFPSGFQINNIYTNNQLTQIQTPEGNIDLSYLCSSKVGSISNGTDTISYGYDGKLLTSETLNGTLNQTLIYGYNNDFDLISFTYAGNTYSYTYDNDGLLTGAGSLAIARNAQNGLPETVSGGGLTLSRAFNGYAEIEGENFSINGQSLSSWTTARDSAGRITAKTETVDGVTANFAYSYDPMGRLLAVTKDGALVEEYQYDTNGTRFHEMNSLRGIASRTMTYSDEDHLLTAGGATYQYDVDGFLVTKTQGSETTTYNYSSRGELLSVALPDGRIIEYVHDPLARRIAKKVNGVVVGKYLWQGTSRLLAVYDGSDNLLMRFDYADGRMPVSMASGGSTYYLGYDQIGSLRVVTDSIGNAAKRIDYDSFGNILGDSNPAFTVPFGFAGGLHDRDIGLVRFGARDYDPDIGRWTAKDPIFFAGGDTDLFGYVQNDPINFVDPFGLEGGFFDRVIKWYKRYDKIDQAKNAKELNDNLEKLGSERDKRDQALLDMMDAALGDGTCDVETLEDAAERKDKAEEGIVNAGKAATKNAIKVKGTSTNPF
jgi:RHS repeat-associated protein